MASEQEKPAKANAKQILPSLQRLPAAEPAMASGQEKPAKANAQQTLPSLQTLPASEPAMASETTQAGINKKKVSNSGAIINVIRNLELYP